ncbi:hypothetical protein ACSHWB_04055 [Lentzea sp. HUAS TT2]|uniref:hypothetical protein n=1 Tax=Lentzea sp. HUAS TT2 TaxID=3447454 RepID=UPI003F721B6C
MDHDPPDLGPAAHDALDWETCPSELIIYCFTRTLVSAIQLYQELRVFEGDPEVKLVWVICPGSRFKREIDDWLRTKEIKPIPYNTAAAGRRDLILTTSEWIDPLPFAPTPILVLLHGVGFHKFVKDRDTGEYRLSGLARPEGLITGQTTQTVTHPDQVRQLAEACEHTVGRTAFVGDSNFDLLCASRGERATYRKALGVTDDQRLITLSSTWGRSSLFGRRSKLIDLLLAQLPCERYRLAIFLHPAVWSFEGTSEILRRLKPHIESGRLMVIPTAAGWHATVLASDLVIGDFGSTSLYSAMMDIPLLLATFSKNVVPGTVMADLGNGMASPIVLGLDLREQIEAEIERHDHSRAAHLVERLITHPGRSAELLRDLCFRTARKKVQPREFEVCSAPAPEPYRHAAHYFKFDFRVDGTEVTGDLYLAPFREKLGLTGERLLAEVGGNVLKRYANASVIFDPTPASAGSTKAHLTELSQRYPGCRVVAVLRDDSSCEILTWDGRQFRVTCDRGLPARMLAVACYSLVVAQQELYGEFTLRTSLGVATMTVTPV